MLAINANFVLSGWGTVLFALHHSATEFWPVLHSTGFCFMQWTTWCHLLQARHSFHNVYVIEHLSGRVIKWWAYYWSRCDCQRSDKKSKKTKRGSNMNAFIWKKQNRMWTFSAYYSYNAFDKITNRQVIRKRRNSVQLQACSSYRDRFRLYPLSLTQSIDCKLSKQRPDEVNSKLPDARHPDVMITQSLHLLGIVTLYVTCKSLWAQFVY